MKEIDYVKGLVSCVIPCYNVEKYLEECMETIVNQTYKFVELIFIDDGSTDSTYDILNRFKKENESKTRIIHLKHHENNQGICAAINTGFASVHGEFITWFDSDDLLDEKCIEKKVSFLKDNGEYQCVMAQADIFDNDDVNQVIGKLGDEVHVGNPFDNYLLSYCAPSAGLNMCYTNTLFRVLPDMGLRKDVTEQNWYMMLLLAAAVRIGFIDDIVYHYRINYESDSHKKKLRIGFDYKEFWNQVDRVRFAAITDSKLPYVYKCRHYNLQSLNSITDRLLTIDDEQINKDTEYVKFVIESFLCQGDVISNIKGRKVFIWGKTSRIKRLKNLLKNYLNIEGFIDSKVEDFSEKVICGTKIDVSNMYIIIPLRYYMEIEGLLRKAKFVQGRDYYYPKAKIYNDVVKYKNLNYYNFLEFTQGSEN